jgi:hypothetical protein
VLLLPTCGGGSISNIISCESPPGNHDLRYIVVQSLYTPGRGRRPAALAHSLACSSARQ